MSKNQSATPRQGLIIERRYRASAEEIWELWTTKDGFESWWGPEGFRVDVHTLEARVGGTLYYDMVADSPETVAAMAAIGRPPSHETRGTFTLLEPYSRLAITHVIDFLPDVTPYDSTISVELVASGPSVLMKVTLSPMHDEHVTRMQLEGFTSQLTKLDKRFAGA